MKPSSEMKINETMYIREIFKNNGKPSKKGKVKDKKIKLLTPDSQAKF
jgi:hypothetical protein